MSDEPNANQPADEPPGSTSTSTPTSSKGLETEDVAAVRRWPTPKPFAVPHPVESATGESTSDASLAAALEPPPEVTLAEVWEKRARLSEDRLAQVLEAFRNLRTETEEHRERTTRSLEHRFTQQRERFVLKFIEIMDNLDRGLEAAERTFASDAMVQGLILVRTQLLQTLREEGLERIPTLGLPFDPEVSESVGHLAVGEPDQDHLVVKEVQRGYRLGTRIARHSRVLVGKYDPEAYAEAEAQRAKLDSPPDPAAGITPLSEDET
ncbi:MAG: nucleotide exchange factor GrpE [Vicinamibacteria bacterium]|nr:nucleotide exchange factor GrpE [Vicinamibacteria bacterium]